MACMLLLWVLLVEFTDTSVCDFCLVEFLVDQFEIYISIKHVFTNGHWL